MEFKIYNLINNMKTKPNWKSNKLIALYNNKIFCINSLYKKKKKN